MYKVFKYSFFDLIRSRWSLIYFGFYLMLTTGLLMLSGEASRVIVSLLNVILLLSPLIATFFGVTYFYNSREFVELLLAQPIPRAAIFLGQFLGMALSLSLSLLAGIGLPFLVLGGSTQLGNLAVLLLDGVLLSFIFSGIAYYIALRNDNKIRGFGWALAIWLFFAVIYDGILLMLLFWLREYPLEKFALFAAMSNPIDLSRIFVLLRLDLSAIMGYTGAVFRHLLGSGAGVAAALFLLLVWVLGPIWSIRRKAMSKDF